MLLSEDQKKRYARQLCIPEIGPEGQEKLLSSKVLIIGVGGSAHLSGCILPLPE